MPTNSDFKELLNALNEYEVKYLIIGGYAVMLGGSYGREWEQALCGAGRIRGATGVDILTSVTGMQFEEAWPKRVEKDFGGLRTFFFRATI